ncbi:sodium- and chloride-dependent GABA transporter 1-like isoform X2 [Ptychodera flava]|uniref:sodium- and chloride-dependent GABA transporter 1-like isoform X2 n=1 Tax=Ptychodera flava TaxID=63121 RepID=UPI00396A69F6
MADDNSVSYEGIELDSKTADGDTSNAEGRHDDSGEVAVNGLPASEEKQLEKTAIDEQNQDAESLDNNDERDLEKADNIDDENDDDDRGGWDSKADFILACIGYAVGLGNIWRFPYLCYKNGGGAFLIPYVLCLFFLGIPLFMLEIGLGQYLQLGGISAWQVVPVFKGVGYASATISCLLNIYYIVIIAWVNIYLVCSFFPTLPWTQCDEWWNDDYCYDPKTMNTTSNGTEFITGEFNNITIPVSEAETPSEQFWYNFVLQISGGIDEIDGIIWYLAVSLVLAWLLVYVCIAKGVKTTGKIVWFTTTFPYVVLTILLIRAVTLEGAGDGIYFYLVPDLARLADAQVWVDAGSQIFFSLGIGIASLISLGSYNKYNNNIFIDTFTVCLVNCGTSFYAGFMIFATLGYMANEQGKEVKDVVADGPGLTFITVPTAIAEIPGAQFWAILFFIMLLLLGLDSQFCVVEGFYTCISDEYPRIFRKHRPLCLAILCCIYYVLALPCITHAGMYIFTLMDGWGASGYVLLWAGLWECIAVSYGFGLKNYINALKDMLSEASCYGRPVFWIFGALWCFICPALLIGIQIFSFTSYSGAYYEDYRYPLWGEVLGWLMAAFSMHWVISYSIYAFVVTPGTFKQRWHTLFSPRPNLVLRGRPGYEKSAPAGEKNQEISTPPPAYDNFAYSSEVQTKVSDNPDDQTTIF